MSTCHRQGTAFPRSAWIRLAQVEHFDRCLQLRVKSHFYGPTIQTIFFSNEILISSVVWLRQLGLFNHWRSAFLPGPNRCSVPVSTLRSKPHKRLTLNYLSSAFLLWGVGVVISTLAFLFERISSYFRNKNYV